MTNSIVVRRKLHIANGYKVCSRADKCSNPLGYILPATLEYFPPNKKTKCGLDSWCRCCHNVANQTIRQQPGEKEKNLSRYHQMMKNPEKHAHKLQRDRNNWPQRRETHRIKQSNRRAKVRNLPHSFTKADKERMLNYWDHRCAACGKQADFWTVIAYDHWIPLSSHDCPGTIPANMIPLCNSRKGYPTGTTCCNDSKHNKDAHTWLVKRFGKRKAATIEKRVQSYFDWIEAQN